MRIQAPSDAIFWTSVVLVVLALVGHFSPETPLVAQYQFWIAITASVVLALGCVDQGETPK